MEGYREVWEAACESVRGGDEAKVLKLFHTAMILHTEVSCPYYERDKARNTEVGCLVRRSPCCRWERCAARQPQTRPLIKV